jgi:hypothetical protein
LDGSFYSRNCFLGEFLDFSTELLSFVNFWQILTEILRNSKQKSLIIP